MVPCIKPEGGERVINKFQRQYKDNKNNGQKPLQNNRSTPNILCNPIWQERLHPESELMQSNEMIRQ